MAKTKEQTKEYMKQWRQRNQESIAIKRKVIIKKLREENNLWMLNYKKDKSCQMCGWKEHPEILLFHHLKEKFFSISDARHRYIISSLLKEIEKCLIICPNCHQWLHYQEKKSFPEKV